jgi:PAS domain S-box-containing protein
MKDEDKTKEQLIEELVEIHTRVNKIEAAYTEFDRAIAKLISFEKALETMQIGVTITDLEGNILYVNSADLELHCYSAEELRGKNVRIFAPDKKWKPLTVEQVASMKKWKRVSVNIKKDGSVFPVQLMSDVIKDADGRPICIVTTCEDITDRKKMEDEIKERIEDLEKFYQASIHREVKMKELKVIINKLNEELSQYKNNAQLLSYPSIVNR